jgi:hypothetical protein
LTTPDLGEIIGMANMWRAWGIILFLSSQDPAAPFQSEDHEMAFLPPPGWVRREGARPFIVKFIPGDALRSAAESNGALPSWGLVLSHLYYPSNPTPLQGFVRQAKEHIAREFKSSKMVEEGELKIGERLGYRMVFTHEGSLYLKTVLPRTNLECYLLDASMPQREESKFRPVVESSIASFRLVIASLGPEERAAEARTLDVLKSAKVDPGILGESWQAVFLMNTKTGSQRTRVSPSSDGYAFELDIQDDFGEGGKDATTVRGSFSPDGRTQKIETEHTKQNAKERWIFRAAAVLEQGRVKASRDMNGVKEEKTFRVEPGVLFEDVADILRRSLFRGRGKGTYLFRTLSPYSDEPEPELMEVNDPEPLEMNGARRSLWIVFSRVGHRKQMTYYYDTQGGLVRVGGMRDAFSLRLSTKEEATRP